jgi:hypothetical protein
MWKDTRLPRAPENKRTGIEINPKVRNPVQTDAAMRSPLYPSGLDAPGTLACRMVA